MRKNGIVLQKTNKRDAVSFLLFVFLLPYICACLWGHVGEERECLEAEKTAREKKGRSVEAVVEWGIWELSMEEYLVYRLFLVMPGEHEPEALKAQAVLLRTELATQYGGEGEKIRVAGDGLAGFYAGTEGADAEELEKCRQAVEETKGVILTYRGAPIRAAYFRASNGATRAAGEKDYPYLRAVSCEQDKASPDFRSVAEAEKGVYLEKLASVLGEDCEPEELWNNLHIEADDGGYVTSVSCFTEEGEERRTDGETVRHLFGLASASFEISREKDRVFFYVTGVGHGFGMSQYGADCRAKEGAVCEEILEEFFFQTELAKFE